MKKSAVKSMDYRHSHETKTYDSKKKKRGREIRITLHITYLTIV